jgi:hypothetical protein
MAENQGPSIESTLFSTDIYIHDIFPGGGSGGNSFTAGDILHYAAGILDNHINQQPIGRSTPLFEEQDLLSIDDRYIEIEERVRLDAMLIDLIRPIQYRVEPPPPPLLEPHPDSDFWEPVASRLTYEEFDEIVPTHRMSKSIRKKYNMEDPICSICQEDINSRQHCSILKCGHIYHKNCIKTWLTKTCEKPTCPCCRMDVRDVVKQSPP